MDHARGSLDAGMLLKIMNTTSISVWYGRERGNRRKQWNPRRRTQRVFKDAAAAISKERKNRDNRWHKGAYQYDGRRSQGTTVTIHQDMAKGKGTDRRKEKERAAETERGTGEMERRKRETGNSARKATVRLQ